MASLGSDSFNPYAAPEAALSDSVPAIGVAGGSLERSLAADTGWTISEIMGDAWRQVAGFKGTFWMAAAAVWAASLIAGIVTQLVGATTELPLASLIVNLLLSVLTWPLSVGLYMLGVRRAAGAETRAAMIGELYPQTGKIAGLMFLQSFLVMLGMVLLIIPGIYLAVAYLIAIPLMIDRRMGVWQALETSRRVITRCWFRTAGLMLVVGLINMAAIITLGIGWIWTLPFSAIVIGMLYHRVAGYVGGEAG